MFTRRRNAPRAGSPRWRPCSAGKQPGTPSTCPAPWRLLACALGAFALACGSDGDAVDAVDAQDGIDDAPPPRCLWEPTELLSHVEVSAADLSDCGQTQPGDPEAVGCFTSALEAGEAAQVTINNCIDCLILSTYVTLPGNGEFHLYREADLYGDDQRVVRVESCSDVVPAAGGLGCSDPAVLYRCADPLPDPSTL